MICRRVSSKHRAGRLLPALLLAFGIFALFMAGADASLEDRCAPGALIIQFDPGVVSFPPEIDYGHNRFILPLEDAEFELPSLGSLFSQLGAISFETIAPHWRHLTERDQYDRHGNRVDLVDFTDVYRVTFDENQIPGIEDLIEIIREEAGITHVECDRLAQLFSTPNDSLFPDQWNLNNTGQNVGGLACLPFYDINAPEAWDIWNSAGTKIGICDSGIEDVHEDLQGFIATDICSSFVKGKDWNEVGPGYTGSHGTKTAGIAGAGGNNDSIGVAGVANLSQDSVLVALRLIGDLGENDEAAVVPRACDALDYISNEPIYDKILVVNNGWGYGHYKDCYSYSAFLRNAFRNAFMKDISLVCGSGDLLQCDSGDTCSSSDTCFAFPAAFDDFSLGVGAILCTGELYDDYYVGSYIDLVAPAGGCPTTTIGNRYGGFGGTSAASPHASGVIALLLGRDPTLTNEDCYHLLEVAAAPLDSPAVKVGHGLLKADSALAAVTYPSAVIRASVFADDSNLEFLEEREQWFMNVDNLGMKGETWKEFWVEVYKLEVVAFLWDEDYASIDTVWIRGKHTKGAKNLTNPPKYDALFHAGYAELDSFDGEKATLRTYVYKIFNEEGGDSLGWFPEDPAEGIRIDYSVLLRYKVGTRKLASPRASIQYFRPERLPSAGQAVLRPGLARPGVYTVGIYDVMGRRVRGVIKDTRLDAGEHRLVWDGRNRQGRPVASGLYFARLQNMDPKVDGRVRRARLLLLR